MLSNPNKSFVFILFLVVLSTFLFSQALGDVNNDGGVNILDALLIAQYYVGLNPPVFYPDVADVNCDGFINIIDALIIARYYVGLIIELPCDITPTPTPGNTPEPTGIGLVIFNDLGDTNDFLPEEQIYLIRTEFEGNYNIPGDSADFIHQETLTNYNVFTSAPNSSDLITSRVIRMSTYAEFRTLAIGQGEELYLAIRYKDNLPQLFIPAPVYVNNGTDWIKIGALGGNFDHTWKVDIFTVYSYQAASINGEYQFKIGTGLYTIGINGDLPIDRIELSNRMELLVIEPVVPGLYPAEDGGNFEGLTKDYPWYVDGLPYFPIGFAMGWDGIPEMSWQTISDGGFNTVLFYNDMDIYNPYDAGDIWGTLPASDQYGFSEFLGKCSETGLKAIGVFKNDIKYSVVQSYFGSEQNTLDFINSVCTNYGSHPALLAWAQVDEPDYSIIPEYYAPLEWCMTLKDSIRQADPDHPFCSMINGWRLGAYSHYMDIADYLGFPYFPEYGSSTKVIGMVTDQLTIETNYQKPYIAYLKAFDRLESQANMSYSESYIALIHGACGIFYWDYKSSAPIFSALSAIVNEINTLSDVILPPSITVDVNGENSYCINSYSEQIENMMKMLPTGECYIFSANCENISANNVQFNVAGLPQGRVIEVIFEGRTITAQDGYFIDNFSGYSRHIYMVGVLGGL